MHYHTSLKVSILVPCISSLAWIFGNMNKVSLYHNKYICKSCWLLSTWVMLGLSLCLWTLIKNSLSLLTHPLQIFTFPTNWLVLSFGYSIPDLISIFQWVSWQVLWVLLCKPIGTLDCACSILSPYPLLASSTKLTKISLKLLLCLGGKIQIWQAMLTHIILLQIIVSPWV